VADREALHLATPAELKRRLEADRAGTAYLLYREPGFGERILPLQESAAVIGRDAVCDAPLAWDDRVSRLHVELANLRGHWLVVDDGLSRNGTFVNGERVVGRRRLHNGDQLLVGATSLRFCEVQARDRQKTAVPESPKAGRLELSPAQRRVLVALCRSVQGVDQFDAPATNQQIADELFLSVAAVKTHLRSLAQRFGLTDVPQNAKRARLVRMALELELVTPADYREVS
jgi:pSer/pThr/pTyr-binding forkhead associated (FHA) protein